MEPGELVANRFEIESLAGSGGMGAVYRAHDRHTAKKVALKVVRGEWDERFIRESTLLAELNHPGVVRYVAHGQALSGELYLAMEWLEGEDLADRLSYSALTVAQSVRLAEKVARALAVAHGRGMIHRDIKPSNLFLHEGEIEGVKIVDFGLARHENATRGAVTKTGSLLGTPGYMAPEQARGDANVDARADVFSLGCVLFECLTGRPPFVGEHVMALLAKILLEDAPRLRLLRPDLPVALDELVGRMLAKDASLRPPDATRLAEELAALGTLAGGRPEYAFGNTPSITRGAQRLVFVVLAGDLQQAADSFGHTHPLGSGTGSTATDRVRSAARVHGGRVEPFANGAVVATFAGTGAATDQAIHAARAALAIRTLLPDAPMALAAGLGDVTTMAAVGEVIDRAARLLEAAPPSSGRTRPIRIDEVTAGLLDLRFDVSGDVRGLELRGEREVVDRTRTLLGKPSPCVGRERELGALDSIFAECTSEPVARAVLVTAAAGVGKSRLRFEYLKRLHDRGDAVELWEGRGDPLSAGSPFAMLAPAMRRAAGILDGEPAAVRRKKLRARIGRVVPASELQRVSEFIGVLVGAHDLRGTPAADESVQLRAARNDAMLMGDQMRRAWIDWLTAECAVNPVMIVLEDLQWGDLPSVQFVDAALRTLSDAPLMVFALARPDVHDIFPRLWASRAVTEMRLGELTRKAGERLVREVLGADAGEVVVSRIVSQAAGNAFFLEELIRAVAEGKGDELPTTVLAMVQARLLELEEDTRRTLRAASIFGRMFWSGGVQALLGDSMDARAVLERLAELADRELIARRGEGKFPGQEEFIFRNAVPLEAAYAMLTDKDCVIGHRIAAEWLVEAGERDAAVIAEHFERGKEPGRAIAFFRVAAEHALEGNDLTAALARAQRGVECGAEGELLGALRAIQAEAHKWRGENAEAEACGLEALRLLPRGSPLWYHAAGDVNSTSARRGNPEPLSAILLGLLQIEETSAPTAEYLVLCIRVAVRLLDSGDYDRAMAIFGRVDEQASPFMDDLYVAAWVLDGRAIRALYAGDPGEYLRLMYDVVNHFETMGDFRTACLHRVNAGYAFAQVGAYAESERVLREALALSERIGLQNSAASSRQNLGFALAHRGALDEAREVESESVANFHAQGGKRMEGSSRGYLAFILALQGDFEAAEKEAIAGCELLEAARPLLVYAHARLAQVRLMRGNAVGALEASSEGIRMLEVLGAIEDGESLLRLIHAEALHATGHEGEARVAIAEAERRLLERAERIADPTWRASFLDRVPENARTRRLSREWGAHR